MRFEWDKRKASSNKRKHGVSFAEAIDVFKDALSLTYPDPDHSDEEDRFLIIGLSGEARVLVVVHTYRIDAIRIISARKATTKECTFYEAQARH